VILAAIKMLVAPSCSISISAFATWLRVCASSHRMTVGQAEAIRSKNGLDIGLHKIIAT